MEEVLDELSNEILKILRYQRAYRRTIERMKRILAQGTRAELADTIIVLKCVENDLVIRLCKLNDQGSRTISFKNTLATLKKSGKSKQQIKDAELMHQKYNELAKQLKIRRNKELGHLEKGHIDHYDPKYDLIPVIKIAVAMTDILNDHIIKYSWKDDQIIEDLRTEINLD